MRSDPVGDGDMTTDDGHGTPRCAELAERTTSSRANGTTDIPCRRARRVPVAAASSGHERLTGV